MNDRSEEIRRVAKRLLAEGKADVVIGFRDSRLPLRATPHFARTPAEADQLVWGLGCTSNLAKYLLDREECVAVVAKGCDVRAIVATVKENQVNRDRVTIIGVPCAGVVSWQKLEAVLNGRDLTEAIQDGDTLVLRGREFEQRVAISDLLQDACRTCTVHEPVVCDVRIASSAPAGGRTDEFADIREFEALSPDERWEWFRREFSRCIRCYACRNACPACYCEQCFVDSTNPEWIGKGNDLTDTLIFHIVRAFHSAGRCVDCGACERACPMGIDLRRLTRKVQKDVKELFGADAGVDPDSPPALAVFRPDDPEDFTW